MEQPLMLQCDCVDCPNYEGFGQCYHYGNITDEIQKECVFEEDFKPLDHKEQTNNKEL